MNNDTRQMLFRKFTDDEYQYAMLVSAIMVEFDRVLEELFPGKLILRWQPHKVGFHIAVGRALNNVYSAHRDDLYHHCINLDDFHELNSENRVLILRVPPKYLMRVVTFSVSNADNDGEPIGEFLILGDNDKPVPGVKSIPLAANYICVQGPGMQAHFKHAVKITLKESLTPGQKSKVFVRAIFSARQTLDSSDKDIVQTLAKSDESKPQLDNYYKDYTINQVWDHCANGKELREYRGEGTSTLPTTEMALPLPEVQNKTSIPCQFQSSLFWSFVVVLSSA